MTHIGQIIHWTDISGYGGCYAAITTYIADPRHDTLRNAVNGHNHINLTYFGALGPQVYVSAPQDPIDGPITARAADGTLVINQAPTDYTPGTWHHLHP